MVIQHLHVIIQTFGGTDVLNTSHFTCSLDGRNEMCSSTTSHSFSGSTPETLFQESFSITVRIDYLNCTDFTSTLGMYNITYTHAHAYTHAHMPVLSCHEATKNGHACPVGATSPNASCVNWHSVIFSQEFLVYLLNSFLSFLYLVVIPTHVHMHTHTHTHTHVHCDTHAQCHTKRITS